MKTVDRSLPTRLNAPVESRRLYRRACEIFLGGTQTISKQPRHYDSDCFPTYIERGRGSRLWDVDGNEYIDYVMALGPILLGYCHPAVDNAVQEQLRRGVLFSGNSPLEVQLGEQLLKMIPNAEKMRFFKTGAEATSAAVRLCRNFTGREKIVSCGYHGWHDWCLAKKDAPGVPVALRELILDLPYGDVDLARAHFENYGDEIACAILEPVILRLDVDFLEEVVRLAHSCGTLVVFDEIITGFRSALGGIQERTGLRADLAVFGKALANGFPLSVVTGRRDIFEAAENLWISSTFGGEALSLAAALATLETISRPETLQQMRSAGALLLDGWRQLLARYPSVNAKAIGDEVMPVLHFATDAVAQEDIFIRRMLEQGYVTRRKHYWFICASHTRAEVEGTLEACREAFDAIQDHF